MRAARSERGAALLAVLAMVALLAGLASLGLSRLRAASDRITDSAARAEAQLAAASATEAALAVVGQLKARARLDPAALAEPIDLPLGAARIEARFAEGGNCFNLNSLARPPATTSTGEAPPAARPQDFARLLAAAGIPQMEASSVAQATAARLAQTGQLWADASEWTAVPGVTARHWQLAGPLLCALPTRERAALNINSLRAADAPLLTAMGLGADAARRAIAGRPTGGWPSGQDFLAASGQGTDAAAEGSAAADSLGTSTRWMALTLVVSTPDVTIGRDLLIDTLQTPATVVRSRWRAVEGAA